MGFREGTCQEETKKLKCKIPCNWKKEFGGERSSGLEEDSGNDATILSEPQEASQVVFKFKCERVNPNN